MPPPPADPHVYLGLGSNLGDGVHNLARAARSLASLPQLSVGRTSSLYASAALGPEQPDYLNAAVECGWVGSPRGLLQALKGLEVKLGRSPGPRWGPRIIDIDILFWGSNVVAEPDLQIPHLRLHQRAFATMPLAELCPHAKHPILHQTMSELVVRADQGPARKVGPFPRG